MKKLLSFVAAIFIAATTFAQVDEVTLTTIGVGNGEEEATNNAFRNALEQAFGTFVSANTKVLNDDLTNDEIAVIDQGYVKNYEKISVNFFPNGRVSVTIKATVSINKLISYSSNKGVKTEFAGSTYAANVNLMKLKVKSSEKALDIIVNELEHFKNMMFDFELKLEQPKLQKSIPNFEESNPNYYVFNACVNIYSNAYSSNFYNLLNSTMKAIQLSNEEISQFKDAGIETDYICIGKGTTAITIPLTQKACWNYLSKINSIIEQSMRRYKVQEIQNKSNSYYWSEKKSGKQFFRSENQSHNSYTHGLWSNLCNGYMEVDVMYNYNLRKLRDLTTVEKFFNGGAGRTIMVNPLFQIEEIHIPLQLSKKQKKDLEKGKYVGPTYKIEYGEQKQIACEPIKLFIKEDRMSLFQGFELSGVSAPSQPAADKTSIRVNAKRANDSQRVRHSYTAPARQQKQTYTAPARQQRQSNRKIK